MDADSLFSFIPIHEAAEIWARLHHVCGPNNLVLSSEIGAFSANCWAEERGHKTFETALSPLLERLNPRSKGYCKTPDQWINYQNGASIMFTLYISTGTETVVLTRPPPVRLRARSSYKELEECWITACCEKDKFKIFFAHPLVNAAQDYIYEYWPEDHINAWMTMYPERGKLQNLNVLWESTAEQPTYRPNDLRQMRDTILKKLYLHTTGASLYWNGLAPATHSKPLHLDDESCTRTGSRPLAAATGNESSAKKRILYIDEAHSRCDERQMKPTREENNAEKHKRDEKKKPKIQEERNEAVEGRQDQKKRARGEGNKGSVGLTGARPNPGKGEKRNTDRQGQQKRPRDEGNEESKGRTGGRSESGKGKKKQTDGQGQQKRLRDEGNEESKGRNGGGQKRRRGMGKMADIKGER